MRFGRRVNLHERKLAVDYDMTLSLFRRRNNFVRLSQCFDHRLLAEDMTTVLYCSQALPKVQGRRSADGDNVGFRRSKQLIDVAKDRH